MPEGPWVVDPSVAAAWFFEDDPDHEIALAVRGQILVDTGRFLVPSVFLSELAHVLARKSGDDVRFVREAMRLVVGMRIPTEALTDAGWARTAYWTCKGLSGNEAVYLTLAEEVAGWWLTSDAAAIELAGRHAAVSVAAWARRFAA